MSNGKYTRAVIGANYGDEGKGLITDYLCRTEGADVVVRFNGGAQAGHTVVAPGGHRHVFSHFGSGTLAGVPTMLSQFFVINPMLYVKERSELKNTLTAMGRAMPLVYASPDCRVTTYADMLINQQMELQRGANRHGSCGVGFNETLKRNGVAPLSMRDLWHYALTNDSQPIERCVETVMSSWARHRIGRTIRREDLMGEYLAACRLLAQEVKYARIEQFRDPIFEGAQGLLLDRDNRRDFPHLTNSKTGLHNVRKLWGDRIIIPYYVSRTYLTRHGAGPLPGEDPYMHFEDDTNHAGPWQGPLRFAPLDELLLIRIFNDAGVVFNLVLTHCDQVPPSETATLYVYGPKATDVMTERREDGEAVA